MSMKTGHLVEQIFSLTSVVITSYFKMIKNFL